MTEEQLYKLIMKIASPLNLGDFLYDIVADIWLMIRETDKKKWTSGYIKRVLHNQLTNKYNLIYKKYYKYYDYHSELLVEFTADPDDSSSDD